MVPPEFISFFSVSAAAGATLVGLIFVAVSIAPEHIVMDSAPVERQVVAASSFTALFNGFIAQTLSDCGSSCYLWVRNLCWAATHNGAFPIRSPLSPGSTDTWSLCLWASTCLAVAGGTPLWNNRLDY
jgi:hypothetical protein